MDNRDCGVHRVRPDPLIVSAWLINGGHCRWTPFSTDRHYLSLHFISPFPQMDHVSLSTEAHTDRIKILLHPSLLFAA